MKPYAIAAIAALVHCAVAVEISPFAKVSGSGGDDTRAVAGRFSIKPGSPYVFSCEMRHPSGEDKGVAVMSVSGVSMYSRPNGRAWNAVTNAFMAVRGNTSAECILRQWHIPGDTEFRNVCVTEAAPRYRRVGGVELGFGESMDGNMYRYSTRFSLESRNHSRPMAVYGGGELSDGTVKLWSKSELSFVHEIGDREILSARVGVAIDGGDAASAVVSVSRDGVEWADVLSASNTGIFHADVPSSYLPAKKLYARVRRSPAGRVVKLRQYMFDARVDGPAAFGFGATDYLDPETGNALLSVKPWDYLDDTTSGTVLEGAPDGVVVWEQSSGRKVFRGRPAPVARGGALKISAARNEAEARQIVIRPDKPLAGVRVTAEMPEGIDVEVRRVGYLLVDLPMDTMGARGLWPDPIFDQDAKGCDVAAGENQPFWVTAKPRRGMKAGIYRGELKISANEGKSRFSVPMEVRVFDFDFPDRMTCETAFGLTYQTVFDYHHATSKADKVAIAEKYIEMFARHHITPYSPYYGVTAGTYTDKWTKTPDPADSTPVFSWDAWDNAISNALERYHFNTFVLNIRGKGSMDPASRGPQAMRRINGVCETNALYDVYMKRYLEAVESHIRERGWLDKAYIYAFDEPEESDYGYMCEDLDRMRRHAPSLRRMVSTAPNEKLFGSINLWCPITEHYNREMAHARQKAGDGLWWYITFSSKPPKVNEHVEHSGVDMRVWLWQTWMEKVQGVIIWESVCWNRKAIYPDPERPQNPYEDAMVWTSKHPWNSGEGRYVYPPQRCFETKDPVVEGPVDSIRFEMLREGVEDYEYFAMLKRLDPASPLLAVPPEVTSSLDDYSVDPAGMEAHRMRLAEAIERASHPAGGERGKIKCEGEYPWHLQGVATDGTNIFWTFTTVLVKTDLDGRVLGKVEIGRGDGHMGDLCCRNGRVFVGMNLEYRNGCRRGDEVWEYDGAALKLIKKHPTPEAVWCNNGVEFFDGNFWVITSAPRHCRYNMVFRYTADFKFIQCQMIDSGWTNLGVQTVCRHGDKMLFGCYGAPNDGWQPHKPCTLVVDGGALAYRNTRVHGEFPPIVPCERRVEKNTAEGMLVLDGRVMAARSIRLSPESERKNQRWSALLLPISL